MGAWTRAKIEGTCNKDQVDKLRDFVNIGDDFDRFHCLCFIGGDYGLGNWANDKINSVGFLPERNYTPDDVASQLKKLVKIVTSLNVRVHLGDHHGSNNCIATVVCEEGEVTIKEPGIYEIADGTKL